MSNERIQTSNPHAAENAWEGGDGENVPPGVPPGSRPSAPARMFPADRAVAPNREDRRADERLELGRDLASRLANPPRGAGTLVVLRAPAGEDVEDVVRLVEDDLAATGEVVARMVFRGPEQGRESFIGRTRVNDETYRERREYRCGTIASARDLERFGENGVLVVLGAERFGDPEELIEEARRYGKRVLAILTGAPASASAESALVQAAREVRTLGRGFLLDRPPTHTAEPRASTFPVDPAATTRSGSFIKDNLDALLIGAACGCAYILGYIFGADAARSNHRFR